MTTSIADPRLQISRTEVNDYKSFTLSPPQSRLPQNTQSTSFNRISLRKKLHTTTNLRFALLALNASAALNRFSTLSLVSSTEIRSKMIPPSTSKEEPLDTSTVPATVDGGTFVTSKIPTFSFTDFATEKLLGTGSFASVHQVQLKPGLGERISRLEASRHGRYMSSYALKCPKRIQGDDNDENSLSLDEQIMHLDAEAKFLARLDHPNIIHIRGTSNGDCPFLGCFIILDCLRKETLKDRLNSWRRMSKSGRLLRKEERLNCEQRVKRVGLGIVSAMVYLHSKGIIFRDLKPGNIGFDIVDNSVQLFDFGLACNEGESLDGEFAGSLRYMAPEAMQGKIASGKASDVFSFGVVLWELITLKVPYGTRLSSLKKYSQQHSHLSVADALIELVTVKDEKPGTLWCVGSKLLSNVIKGCWDVDPTRRPSFVHLEQALFTSLDDTAPVSSGKAFRLARSMSFGNSSTSSRISVPSFLSRSRREASGSIAQHKFLRQPQLRFGLRTLSEISDLDTRSNASLPCYESPTI